MIRSRIARVFVVFACSAFAVACDSASVYEDCASEEAIGTGEPRCLPSKFLQENARAREVAGFVSYGIERVEDAVVHVADSPGTTGTTNAAGLYRLPFAPFRYDITARFPEDVVTYRGAAFRFLDIALEREVPVRAWTARVTLTLSGGPRPGHAFAFFASGNVVGLRGGLVDGLVVSSRSFDIAARIHVVEYPEEVGLAGATAKGSVDIRTNAGGAAAAHVELAPTLETHTTTFAASPPPGFVAGDVDVILDFGTRMSEALARRVPLGATIALPAMADARWTARLRATRDGAVASSGRRLFAPGEEVTLSLFAPPEPIAPADGGTADAGVLSARGTGVFEHVLVPLDAGDQGRTLHVLTASNDAVVPNAGAVGLPPASGRYAWTVRAFPDFTFVDSISGIDVRLYRAVSASSPRTIVLP